jgi:tetratricopeptide (TPR) repeat protein
VLDDDPRTAAGFVMMAGLEPEQALALLVRAAELERTSGNTLQAARLTAQAVNFLTGEERGKMAIKAAQGLSPHDWFQAEHMAAEAVRALPEDPIAVYVHARILARLRRAEKAHQVLGGLSNAELKSQRGLSQQVHICYALGDMGGVLELWQNHPELKDSLEPAALNLIVGALQNQGDVAGAIVLVRAVLTRADLAPQHRAELIKMLGFIHLGEADYGDAEQAFAESITLRRTQQLHPDAGAHFYWAVALQKMARQREAWPDLEQALLISGQSGDFQMYAVALLIQGDQLIELGQYERADESLRASLEIIECWPLGMDYVEIHGSLHDLYRDWGSVHSGILALKHGRASLDYAQQLSKPGASCVSEGMFYAVMAEAHFGNPKRALEISHEHQAEAQRLRNPRQIYKAAWARGLCSPPLVAQAKRWRSISTHVTSQANKEPCCTAANWVSRWPA